MNKEYKIITALLNPNIYSRPQSKLLGIKGICLHWVGNANSKAINNRHYFNNLPSANKNEIEKARIENRKPKLRYASSHEIIGLDGEVVISVPKNEVAFHAGGTIYKPRVKTLLNGSPNRCLYGIEICHIDWDGKFSDMTYKTLIERAADLLLEFNLAPSKDTIWRHYDVTGKDCPKYYVNNPREWDKLINDITNKFNEKVEVLFVAELQQWQKDMGEKALNSLVDKDVVNNRDEWKKTLGEPVPQWLFWSMLDRLKEGK